MDLYALPLSHIFKKAGRYYWIWLWGGVCAFAIGFGLIFAVLKQITDEAAAGSIALVVTLVLIIPLYVFSQWHYLFKLSRSQISFREDELVVCGSRWKGYTQELYQLDDIVEVRLGQDLNLLDQVGRVLGKGDTLGRMKAGALVVRTASGKSYVFADFDIAFDYNALCDFFEKLNEHLAKKAAEQTDETASHS